MKRSPGAATAAAAGDDASRLQQDQQRNSDSGSAASRYRGACASNLCSRILRLGAFHLLLVWEQELQLYMSALCAVLCRQDGRTRQRCATFKNDHTRVTCLGRVSTRQCGRRLTCDESGGQALEEGKIFDTFISRMWSDHTLVKDK